MAADRDVTDRPADPTSAWSARCRRRLHLTRPVVTPLAPLAPFLCRQSALRRSHRSCSRRTGAAAAAATGATASRWSLTTERVRASRSSGLKLSALYPARMTCLALSGSPETKAQSSGLPGTPPKSTTRCRKSDMNTSGDSPSRRRRQQKASYATKSSMANAAKFSALPPTSRGWWLASVTRPRRPRPPAAAAPQT